MNAFTTHAALPSDGSVSGVDADRFPFMLVTSLAGSLISLLAVWLSTAAAFSPAFVA
ncbi:hypothetical protein A7A08_01153 [Methyloligella halotolerans]|uniref:Uncharacterized protein n=1 Tax=Methyloligella halotolerans TaxID=1177755 RepID=A0A1E2S0J0_9HYPH|nr:hypothetical protein [Methyloligella halotolerans]ODA67984.1 hypothetical protein A7A08_01153 [Methyloligella halotolerans]